MSYTTGFYEGRLGIGLGSTMGMGDGNPRYPLDINGDIRLTGSIVNGDGQVLSLVPAESLWTIGTTDITYTGGNVGIGTTSPGSTLEIKDLTSGTAGEVESILKVNSVSGYHMVSLGTAGPTNYHSGSISIYKTMGATGTTKSVHLSGSTDHTYFNGGGNVGIGTTTPSQALDVIGSIKSSVFLILNNGYSLYWGDGKSKIAGFGGTTGNIQFNTNSNERMRITAEGYILINQTVDLGLGTGAKLQVNGTGVFCYNGDKDNSISISHNGSRALINSRSTTHNLDFYVNGDPRLSIKPNGNVGIGTTSPQTKLDVAGDYSKNGEMISMTSQYGLNAKASIYRKWHREEDSNWGLYWINASSDFDYEDIMAYHATTDTSITPTTGVTMSQFMSNYSPGDNGENIGSCSYTHGTYAHTTFPISAGRRFNSYSYSTIRTDADAWSEQPYRAGGDSTNVMYTGYIKCNETATYYFGWYAKHYYRGLLFIQNPNEGSGKAWNFGNPGWQVNFQCRTNGVDMTAGKYYKFTFLMKGSGYYYYAGAVGMLGWSQSSANWSTPSNYYAADVGSVAHTGYLNATRTIDSVANWQTRFGWISDDSPLQFVKRIPN